MTAPSTQKATATIETIRRPVGEAVRSLLVISWVVPRTAREVKASIARDWPAFMEKVLAAKNIPSRFSPVLMPSSSATSATIDWGMMPRRAMGKAAMITIRMPNTTPGRGSIPIRAVMT